MYPLPQDRSRLAERIDAALSTLAVATAKLKVAKALGDAGEPAGEDYGQARAFVSAALELIK